ncbi:hypothetical protein BD410DRAFT_788476 [Rickenella mellea]|uniref:Uncharacterized protein n=1 Tax=Rickenella mellea TaxID=50990 RepID=A0A4Y7Q618_9AGAM|nr:hypothetical protein BD410DRAFT_788476 [Rickenella mellea]
MNALDHFGPLDELIQLIYLGIHRFVLISRSDEDSWTVHLGLTDEGRWWRGRWVNADILSFVGSKASSKYVEAFAEKLAEAVVGGDLHVGDWKPEPGAKISIIFGPTNKTPVSIPLVELSARDAASHATNELFSIGLQAQSRKCHLNVSQYSSPAVDVTTSTHSARSPTKVSSSKRCPPSPSTSKAPDTKAQDQIDSLRERLAQAKAQAEQKSPPPESKLAPKPQKGASVAHPRKKARKLQAIEFVSDEE